MRNTITGPIQLSLSINQPGEVSRGLDIHRAELGMALSYWLRQDTQRSMYPAVGYPPSGGYPSHIYPNPPISHQPIASYGIWIYPISCTRYRQGRVFYGMDNYRMSTKMTYRTGNSWNPTGRNTIYGDPIVWFRGKFLRRQVVIEPIGFPAKWSTIGKDMIDRIGRI